MAARRINIGSIRREQIVAAAAAVIAEQGIQHLSLSEIEKKVGMSRGQLTYYFKAKEDILLAVFDRMLGMMCQQQGKPGDRPEDHPWFARPWLEVLRHLMGMVLQQPPEHPEFHALQYTFLSQISHREDFRQRLADLYEKWRQGMSAHLARDLDASPPERPVNPRGLATVVLALLHGLAMQRAADPLGVGAEEAIELSLDLLSSYLWSAGPAAPPSMGRKIPGPSAKNSKNGHARLPGGRRPLTR